MRAITRWVDENIGSSSMLLLAPLVMAGVRRELRELSQMYFNLHLRRRVRRLFPFLDPFVTVDITAGNKAGYYVSSERAKSSHAYEEVKAYLSAACSRDARELHADGAVEGDGFVLSLREGQEVADDFRGVTVWWSSVRPPGKGGEQQCGLRLTFHQQHRELVVKEYLPHVRRTGRDVMFGNRRRRLYTNKKNIDYVSRSVWSYIDFDHPTTFDTLAMHPAKKRRIMDDLDDFRDNRDYYRRIGKAWKRGYLLYGPPGTGKSTMVAAMANYLNYDIYDIELTMVHSNNDLRKLFIETKGKSIVVIEDIDCSLDLTGQRTADQLPASFAQALALNNNKRKRSSLVTLSGLLNFIDGLWSAHSGERIIVFTTNFVDKLDPALIRRGRMDMHVEMSYCCFEAFVTLANNYLGVDDHPLFGVVKDLLQEVEITPADVAECLLTSKRTERGADACLGRLIDELKTKAADKEKKTAQEEEADKEKQAQEKQAKKPEDKEASNGRKVIDAKSIRRVKRKEDDKKGSRTVDDAAAAVAKPMGTQAALVSDDSSSDDEDKLNAKAYAGAHGAMTIDGGRAGADGGIGDLSDYDGGTDYDDYDDDDDDDYDDDEFDDDY